MAGQREEPPTPEVEVRRSRRRTRTVSAYRQDGPDGKVIVMIPARFTRAEEARWVEQMIARLDRSERRKHRTDEQLIRRARELSREYLHGRAQPVSVRWVDNMTTRWASCTPTDRTIRMSERLQPMPAWVVDYVLLHELAHLLEPSHNARFWHWVDRFPRAERAKGYLEGVSASASLGIAPCD
ncbi:M48 metallopeptidase family protein [Nocardioides terrisoli]|uniref:M48 metallopeptidase family protein n=1 Tax=Nocardioides terrisoli TaxID=3388267 RepID=UPI00287BBD1E|nr:M48 family metallopeptidase [Nocardioides marmorisolisilvae]